MQHNSLNISNLWFLVTIEQFKWLEKYQFSTNCQIAEDFTMKIWPEYIWVNKSRNTFMNGLFRRIRLWSEEKAHHLAPVPGWPVLRVLSMMYQEQAVPLSRASSPPELCVLQWWALSLFSTFSYILKAQTTQLFLKMLEA